MNEKDEHLYTQLNAAIARAEELFRARGFTLFVVVAVDGGFVSWRRVQSRAEGRWGLAFQPLSGAGAQATPLHDASLHQRSLALAVIRDLWILCEKAEERQLAETKAAVAVAKDALAEFETVIAVLETGLMEEDE